MKSVATKPIKAKKILRVRKSKAEAEAAFKAWQDQHADSIDRANTDRQDASLGKATALAAKARATAMGALPAWADLKAIEVKYAEAARLGMVVDHVIPLVGKDRLGKKGKKIVCGLHVPDNLALLTKAENQKKGNQYVLE